MLLIVTFFVYRRPGWWRLPGHHSEVWACLHVLEPGGGDGWGQELPWGQRGQGRGGGAFLCLLNWTQILVVKMFGEKVQCSLQLNEMKCKFKILSRNISFIYFTMLLFCAWVQQAPLSQLVDGLKVSHNPLSNTVVAVIHQQISDILHPYLDLHRYLF